MARIGLQKGWTVEVIASLGAAFGAIVILNWLPTELVRASSDWLLQNNAQELSSWLLFLTNEGSGTDISVLVAQSGALFDSSLGVYSPIKELVLALGIDWAVEHASPSLPLQLPLYIPLLLFPYSAWIKAWAASSVLFLSWSLRLTGLGRSISYSTAVLFSLTAPGFFAAASNYSLLAVLVATAWRFRDLPLVHGSSLVAVGSGRGVGMILLLYPLLTGRFKAVMYALAALTVLGIIVLYLEPKAFKDFFNFGPESARFQRSRLDNLSLPSVSERLGVPLIFVAGMLAIVVFAAVRRAPIFWVLNWAVMAISPVAWSYSVAQAFPLLAYLWRESKWGKLSVVATASSAIATTSYFGILWPTLILASGIGLLGCQNSDLPEVLKSLKSTFRLSELSRG